MLNILLYSQIHSCEEGALHRLLRIKDTLLVVTVCPFPVPVLILKLSVAWVST